MSNFSAEDWINRRKKYKSKLTIDYLFEGILQKDRYILSSAITLIESELISDQLLSKELLDRCLPLSGNSIRIGITGVPGVGKSTFIEVFGKYLINKGKKVAVLSVDPSSELTHGSILGDKTRMEELSKNENAFIRPSSSKNQLGGVAKFTKESIILCEAAGFDVILIETVGVGQSETLVHSMVDFFLLLMLAGAGDELQGIKRGIMELADAIVVTKAEEENKIVAKKAVQYYRQAMHYFPANSNGWEPKVMMYSCFDIKSIETIDKVVDDFFKRKSEIIENRNKQDYYWMFEHLKQLVVNDIQKLNNIHVQQIKLDLTEGKINAFEAARKMYKILKDQYGENRI